MTVEGQDILRQRIAYTLSQLFVVSVKDPAFSAASSVATCANTLMGCSITLLLTFEM